MSYGWENHEPAPLEFFHSKLFDLFHEFRVDKVGTETTVPINGIELGNIIAKSKMATYAKYPKQVNDKSVLKTDL